MNIGLIADIHANYTALEAVLDDMPEVESLVCLGDVVGYNPHPRECIEEIRDSCDLVLCGNHDRGVTIPEEYRKNEMAHEGLIYARKELSEKQIRWLENLPDRKGVWEAGFLSAHSHPDLKKLDDYVMPRDFPRMRPYLNDYDGISIAHTHIQHKAVIDDRLILNPGSVGQPRDGKPTAAYGILDTESDAVELRRTRYNIDRVNHEIIVNDMPKEIGDRLYDGR